MPSTDAVSSARPTRARLVVVAFAIALAIIQYIDRVTISLDSLKRENFQKITGVDHLENVLEAIEAAKAAGLNPVKINAVIVRGWNDDEIVEKLAAQGLTLARRTVAKYRKILNIPTARQRKEY